MIDHLGPAFAVAGAVGAGLNGGVFFAFSTFVMRALARLPVSGGMSAMQAINREAPSPLFMLLLFGTGILSVAAGAIAIAGWDEPWAPYLLAGSALLPRVPNHHRRVPRPAQHGARPTRP